MMPIWEGWDEYAHFAWIQHWTDHSTLPRVNDRISREIDESMRLAPLPRELRWIGAPYLTHPDWWALAPKERETRIASLKALSPALAHEAARELPGHPPFIFYEAQQPPLYYWMASLAMRPFAGLPLRDRIFRMRLLSVFLASIAIPFTFLAARDMACAGLLAIAPGLLIDSAHVANDGLAIGIAAVFLWLMSREKTGWLAAGLTLGLAILVKASLLVLAPILIVLWIRRLRDLGFGLLTALAIGGWWYVRNLLIGAPLTGWQESVPIGVFAASAAHLIRSGSWVNGVQTIAKSFTWFGGWSFLTLRSWMYLVLEGIAFAGMLGGLANWRPNRRAPLAFTILFAIAIAGGAVAYNAVHGIPGIPGWYLWPAGGAMAILIAAGLGQFAVLFAALLALADLFGVIARMIPYYSGLRPLNYDSLSRLHLPIWLLAAWVAATIAIPLLMFEGRIFQGREKTRM